MVSTAETFCCFSGGTVSGSSFRFLFPVGAGSFVSAAATFHGAGGSAVPCVVWKK